MDKLITILGPTATGKTTFAAHLAKLIDAEIISADSRQVYRGMDLGTGKDIEDYTIDGYTVPYHLVDIKDPGYEYNVYEYQKDFLKAYQDIITRGKIAIQCGGTGMYLSSVVQAYDLKEVPVYLSHLYLVWLLYSLTLITNSISGNSIRQLGLNLQCHGVHGFLCSSHLYLWYGVLPT